MRTALEQVVSRKDLDNKIQRKFLKQFAVKINDIKPANPDDSHSISAILSGDSIQGTGQNNNYSEFNQEKRVQGGGNYYNNSSKNSEFLNSVQFSEIKPMAGGQQTMLEDSIMNAMQYGGSGGKQSSDQNLDISQDRKHNDTIISHKYRHKNQNSIYYLKPKTTDIYLLDFKQQGFV